MFHLRRAAPAGRGLDPGHRGLCDRSQQRQRGGPDPYWHSWTYDSVGNRLTQTEHPTAAGGDQVDTVYTYQAAGTSQPHTLTSKSVTDPAEIEEFLGRGRYQKAAKDARGAAGYAQWL